MDCVAWDARRSDLRRRLITAAVLSLVALVLLVGCAPGGSARRQSGYRQYHENDVARIRFIKRAQELGFTLNEVEELLALRVDPTTKCVDVKEQTEGKIADISAKIKTPQRMKRVLTQLAASCDARAPTNECPILEALDRKD